MATEKSMPFRKVIAIIRGEALGKVEQRLHELGVPGISVTRVNGYGEYKNFYNSDWITSHARVETFVPARRADEIAQAIMEAACSGVV
ncbi:MAG: P-II family nitrogen regulator [Gallionella sp.]|nr:P-II family nitrogen regulator [Gallionella sp.]